MSMQARLPPVVNDLLQRLGIDSAECARSDGRFTIDVADCGMVDLIPVSGQRIVLDAVIGDADPDAQVQRRKIEKVLKFAATRMLDFHETVALSDDGDRFHLQSCLDAGMSPVETEDAMSDYLNALMTWRSVMDMSTSSVSGSMPPIRMVGLP